MLHMHDRIEKTIKIPFDNHRPFDSASTTTTTTTTAAPPSIRHQSGADDKQITNGELCEVDKYLEELRELAAKSCRKISIVEKIKLGDDITKLDPENLHKVLEILAQHNPSIQVDAEELNIDISAQSDVTLRRLKVFVKDALQAQAKHSIHGEENRAESNKNASRYHTIGVTAKRKSETQDAPAKTTNKRNKKPSA